MHRKKIRRWHKLLSVSGIIVAVFGMAFMPSATAQVGGPVPDGIYGPVYSKDSQQMVYLDFPKNISGLSTSDLYITGTSTGCVIGTIPNLIGFSFGVWVSGCSDGTYRVNLKAESVQYVNGPSGPTFDYIGSDINVDRSALQINFQNTPLQVTSSNLDFEIALNHPMVYSGMYDLTVNGLGCNILSYSPSTFGLIVHVESCQSGAHASLTINVNGLQDRFGNNGPTTAITSPAVAINLPLPTPTASASASPTPTATPTPTPTATPTASASSSPTATPTASPTATPTATPTALAAAPEPPQPPAAPPVEPVEPAVPAAPAQETAPESAVVGTTPQVVYKTLTKSVVRTVVKDRVVNVPGPTVTITPEPVIRTVVEQQAAQNLDLQPIGYVAMTVGGAAGAVGIVLLMQRMARVRRLRFS